MVSGADDGCKLQCRQHTSRIWMPGSFVWLQHAHLVLAAATGAASAAAAGAGAAWWSLTCVKSFCKETAGQQPAEQDCPAEFQASLEPLCCHGV
jgi:hypothetical protein